MKVTVLVLLATACGGKETLAGSEPVRASASTSPAETGHTSAPVRSEAADDRATIAQLVLDAPALQQYYHAGSAPERAPLAVALNDHVDGAWKLTKFGEPVEMVDPGALGDRPHVRFTRFDVTGDKARVELEYDVEGVAMSAVLERRDAGWVLADTDLVER
jgi:hypothetical protein